MEVGQLEVGSLEVGPSEVGITEVGIMEEGSLEVGLIEVGPTEVGSLKSRRYLGILLSPLIPYPRNRSLEKIDIIFLCKSICCYG